MKQAKAKANVLWIIVLGILAGSFLPRPWNIVVTCVLLIPCVLYFLLIPCVLYLIAHIVKYGNKW